MATKTLQKKASPGAIIVKFLDKKFDALRYLPKIANGILRFDRTGVLIADALGFVLKTAAYTAASGDVIGVNTTAGAITITLPDTAEAGDQIELFDPAGTWDTNNVTVARNGLKIDSGTSNLTLSTEYGRVILRYINATIGWKSYYAAAAADSLAITNDLTVGDDLTVTDDAAVGGDLTVTGNETVGGTLGVTGITTLGERLRLKAIAAPVAAAGAGGGVAGAAQLGNGNELFVSSDGATKGVKLPTGVAGDVVTIHNTSATACNLFAAAGGTINGGVADAGCTIPASKGVRAHCSAADTWTVYDLPAKAGAAA